MQINFSSTIQKRIFRHGSVTYYFSSLFFPKDVRTHVFNLYAFVRLADNFVDQNPQKSKSFYSFCKKTKSAYRTKQLSGDLVIDSFINTAHEKGIKLEWINSFLDSMESDLRFNHYKSYNDLSKYMYGSAEVIGLMMAKILNLPQESYRYARKLGEAMQFVNFIRDIKEDLSFGRIYIPISDLSHFNISVDEFVEGVYSKKVGDLIRFEIDKYRKVSTEAGKGYKYIPKKYLVPITTAANLYIWTAKVIYKNPSIVYEKKVKPTPIRAITMGIKNMLVWNL